jgi:hypothetical protein
VPDEQTEGEGDRGGHEGGEERVLEVFGEAVADAVGAGPLFVADQPVAEVLEEFVHGLRPPFASGGSMA